MAGAHPETATPISLMPLKMRPTGLGHGVSKDRRFICGTGRATGMFNPLSAGRALSLVGASRLPLQARDRGGINTIRLSDN